MSEGHATARSGRIVGRTRKRWFRTVKKKGMKNQNQARIHNMGKTTLNTKEKTRKKGYRQKYIGE